MKKEIVSEFGCICYEEGFWTGKRKITIDGTELGKVDKKTYSLTKVDPETEQSQNLIVRLNGSVFNGVTLTINDQTITVIDKTTTLDYIIAALPVAFVIIWGNIPQLCLIIPVVGGAIGGAVSILFSCLGIFYSKIVNKKYKLLASIGFSLLGIIACILIGYIIVGIALS